VRVSARRERLVLPARQRPGLRSREYAFGSRCCGIEAASV